MALTMMDFLPFLLAAENQRVSNPFLGAPFYKKNHAVEQLESVATKKRRIENENCVVF